MMSDNEMNTDVEEQGVAPILYKFTNQAEAPELETLLSMFYKGAYANRLGIMQAKNVATDCEELLLVGVTLDVHGKTDCYPLARLLTAEEAPNYRSPDGNGGWFDPLDPEEAEAVKETMKPVEECLTDVPLS
jgi:hypothetical protein